MKTITNVFLVLFFLSTSLVLAQPGPPLVTNPSNNATANTISGFAIFWDNFDDGNGVGPYDFELDSTNTFGAPLLSLNGITNSTLILLALQNNNQYWWRVRDTDIDGLGADGSWYTFTFMTQLATPNLSSPANAAINVSIVPTLSWALAQSNDNVVYFIDYDNDGPTFPSAVTVGPLTTLSTTLPALTNYTTYHWRVRAVVQAGPLNATETTSSATSSFTTLPLPPLPPTLNYPAHFDSLVMRRPTFKMTRNYTYPVESLQLQLTADPTFHVIRNTYNNIDTIFQIPLADTLQVGALMYWRVRGFNIAGAGAWSPISRFQVASSGDTLPPTPFPGFPKDNLLVYSYSPMLTWWTNQDARNSRFDIYFSTVPPTAIDTPRTGGAFIFNNVNSFSQALTALSPNTTYYWVARAQRVNNADTIYSWWGPVAQFTTIPLNDPVVPILSYPVDNPTMYTRGVNLNWYLNDVGFGLTYDVQVASDAGFTTIPVNLTGVTQNFIRIIGTPGSTYYWRVRSNNGVATSPWSSTGQFFLWEYIPVPTVATPTLVYPVENATILGVDPLGFSWENVDVLNSVTYEMQIWQGLSLLFDYTGLTNNFHDPSPSLAPGVYQWRVRTKNGIESSAWSANRTFTISVTGTSNIPELLIPTQSSTVLSSSTTLRWFLNFNVAGLSYELQYATSQSGLTAAPIIPVAGGTNVQSHTIAGLVTGQIYYWRVRTTTGTPNPWSEPFYFVVNSNLGVPLPRIGGPGSNVNVISRSPELSWYTIGVRDGMRFTLQYSDNANFTNATTVENLTSRKLRLNNLNEGTTYYWRVRAIDGNNTASSYSEVGSFRVINSPTSVEENEIVEIKEYSLSQNYPNPFNPSTMISYQIPVQSYVTLKIYDVLGNEVATLVNKELASGKYSVEFDASKLSTGIYVYRLSANQTDGKEAKRFVETRKMILVK